MHHGMGYIDHEHSQIRTIVNWDPIDHHEILQAPILFGIAEIELDLEAQPIIIRWDLSGSGLLIIVYKCSLLRELEDRFESQSSASRSGIALGMSPSGVFPQV